MISPCRRAVQHVLWPRKSSRVLTSPLRRSINQGRYRQGGPNTEKFDNAAAILFARSARRILIDRLHMSWVAAACAGAAEARDFDPEWDSVTPTLLEDLDPPECSDGSEVEELSYSYLRGLDGATRARSRAERAMQGCGRMAGGRSADYVRRLVEHHHQGQHQAPGLRHRHDRLGVHDKLVLVQALRDAFPDRVLFTTDMDARLLHPRVTKYTRNLVVASSLPLASRTGCRLVCPKPRRPRQAKRRVGPFRDSYQTATFLAARIAVETATVTDCGDDKQRQRVGMPRERGRGNTEPVRDRAQRHGRLAFRRCGRVGIDQAQTGCDARASPVPGADRVAGGGHPRPAIEPHLPVVFRKGEPFPFPSADRRAGVEVAAMAFRVGVIAEMAMPSNGGAGWPGFPPPWRWRCISVGRYVLPSHIERIVARALSTGWRQRSTSLQPLRSFLLAWSCWQADRRNRDA